MSFTTLVGGLGHAIAYYPRLAKHLGDPCLAIALQQFIYWTLDAKNKRADAAGWVDVVGTTMLNELGMSAKVVTRAKRELAEMGLIEARRGGMPARCQVRVDLDAVDAWWVDKTGASLAQRAKQDLTNGPSMFGLEGKATPLSTKKEEDFRELPLGESISFNQIARGDVDGAHLKSLHECPRHVMEPLLRRWAELWGKSTDRVRMNPERCKAWRAALRDGWKPSEFARAILGMRFDDWPDRHRYCDWKFVHKDLERWLELYDSNRGRAAPKAGEPGTKLVGQTRVPADYVWTQEDDFAAAAGYRFDLEARKWVMPQKAG